MVTPPLCDCLFHPAVSLECLLDVLEFSLIEVEGNMLLEAVLLCFCEASILSLDLRGSISLPCLVCLAGGEYGECIWEW